MMNFDIEKLERKTPYKTPDHFFDAVQDKVLQETIEKKKEVKMTPIYTKWAIAASITLFAGLSAFFISSQNEEIPITKNAIIIDSTYKNNETALSNKTLPENPKVDILAQNNTIKNNNHTSNKIDNTTQKSVKNYSQKSKSNFAKSNSNADHKVNRALAMFTPDQISEIDKSIEQDVYLDLYN